MIDTSKEVKNWYLAQSFNRKGFDNIRDLGTKYQLACTIPQEVNDALNVQSSGEYLGSNLLVTIIGDSTYYSLYYFKGYYDQIDLQYAVGFTVYSLINYEVDYVPYLNSKVYVPLDTLTIDNVYLDNDLFWQAYKEQRQNCITYGNLGASISNFDDVRVTLPRFNTFSGKFIFYNASYNQYSLSDNKKFYNWFLSSSVYEKFISRTPSTWDFSYDLMYKIDNLPKDPSSKSIDSKKIKQDTSSLAIFLGNEGHTKK